MTRLLTDVIDISWRKLRKAAHMGLNLHAAEAYFPIQEREAALLVKSVLEDPSDWDNHCQKCVSNSYSTYNLVCVLIAVYIGPLLRPF